MSTEGPMNWHSGLKNGQDVSNTAPLSKTATRYSRFCFKTHVNKGLRYIPFTKSALLYAGVSAVNVLRELAAAPLAIPAPGHENRRYAVLSTYAVWLIGYGRDATSL